MGFEIQRTVGCVESAAAAKTIEAEKIKRLIASSLKDRFSCLSLQ